MRKEETFEELDDYIYFYNYKRFQKRNKKTKKVCSLMIRESYLLRS
ncbi:hypothetical protein [Streptococcus sp. zg-JUN1979]